MYDEYLLKSFKGLIAREGLLNESVICRPRLGREFNLPSDEYALIRGPEILLECRIAKFKGHAFTPYPLRYEGVLRDMASSIDLSDIGWRGVFFASLNALLSMLGIIEGGTHCSGDKPERCGKELVNYLLRNYGRGVRVLHIGYHPGHVKALVGNFRELHVTDLNREVVGKVKYGVRVVDGSKNSELIKRVDVVLITGSTIVNKTLYGIVEEVFKGGKAGVIYGVTAKGAYSLLKRRFKEFSNLAYFCPS